MGVAGGNGFADAVEVEAAGLICVQVLGLTVDQQAVIHSAQIFRQRLQFPI